MGPVCRPHCLILIQPNPIQHAIIFIRQHIQEPVRALPYIADPRLQAAERPVVTNLLRRRVGLDDPSRAVLVLLDGSRTVADVLEAIVARVARGELELRGASGVVREEGAAREVLASAIGPMLERLAAAALLTG